MRPGVFSPFNCVIGSLSDATLPLVENPSPKVASRRFRVFRRKLGKTAKPPAMLPQAALWVGFLLMATGAHRLQ